MNWKNCMHAFKLGLTYYYTKNRKGTSNMRVSARWLLILSKFHLCILVYDFLNQRDRTYKNANARTSHCMQKGGLGAG